MTKAPIIANVGSSAEASKVSKLSKKELGKQIGGMPDEWDRKNLEVIINLYDKTFSGRLKRMKHDIDFEQALKKHNPDSDRHDGMWMPADLQEVIEAAYPSFWTNVRHKRWFLEKFPVFTIKSTKDSTGVISAE